MLPRTPAELIAWRAAARDAAGKYLESIGFARENLEAWAGDLEVPVDGGRQRVRVSISLPAIFPDVVPVVRVCDSAIPRPFAHVESDDRLCLVQAQAVTLDTSRPPRIVADALERASAILGAALTGRSAPELLAEFLAYWERETAATQITSMVTANAADRARRLHVSSVARGGTDFRYWIADDGERLQQWIKRASGYVMKAADRSAFFLPVARPVPPPDWRTPPTTRNWLAALKDAAESADWHAFEEWLDSTALPAFLVFGLVANGSALPTVACASLASDHRSLERRLQNSATRQGRRRQTAQPRITARAELTRILDEPVRRVPARRIDADFLVRRGGAPSLNGFTVCIVGCGAVGGYIATQVCAMGIGELRLIDPDTLLPENAHRHVLGLFGVDAPKVNVLAGLLERRYPHQAIVPYAEDAETVWRTRPTVFSTADVVVLATGDEVLERRMTSILWPSRLVHAWVEAFGAGGHVFVTGAAGVEPRRGCYECLFQSTGGPITNKANLIAPGQEIGKTLAGCAGFHTPFSALDSERTALDASDAVVRLLLGRQTESQLLTWCGDLPRVVDEGFMLTPRGKAVGSSRMLAHAYEFADPGCPVCAAKRGDDWRPLSIGRDPGDSR